MKPELKFTIRKTPSENGMILSSTTGDISKDFEVATCNVLPYPFRIYIDEKDENKKFVQLFFKDFVNIIESSVVHFNSVQYIFGQPVFMIYIGSHNHLNIYSSEEDVKLEYYFPMPKIVLGYSSPTQTVKDKSKFVKDLIEDKVMINIKDINADISKYVGKLDYVQVLEYNGILYSNIL